MVDKKDLGIEINENYIDRLAENWPEPREQLHFGGWKTTEFLIQKFNFAETNGILDICCGEGGTARWIAKKYKTKVHGVDLLEKAIKNAIKLAKEEGVSKITEFSVSSLYSLPYQNDSFQVIYGQDPDGLAYKDRFKIFEQCYRILKPNGTIGFHLWLPGPDTPKERVKFLEETNEKVGYESMSRLSVDDFFEDLRKAGFKHLKVEDLSEIYRNHVLKMQEIFAKKGQEIDIWHKALLMLWDEGYKVGVWISGRKE